jgi:3-oxoacyl-[acyl-carrier-protein] synthase-3
VLSACAQDSRIGSELLGFGAAQPADVVTAGELGAPFGKTADWVHTRTGIEALRRTKDPAELVALADRAALDAMAAAGLEPRDVDLVVAASCGPPEAAAAIGRRSAPRAAWMHINAACSGFCYGLQTADNLIRTGAARHVLVVAAEHMSRLVDATDLGTSIIFGDGAGAAIVGPADRDRVGVGPTVAGSDGDRRHLIECDASGFLRMAGREVFRWAVESVPPIALEACRRAGVELADIEVFVPHQANLRIVDAVARALQLESAVVVADDIAMSGNTSAASIPMAITRLMERRLVRPGQLTLIVGFGAGLSYAAQVVTLPRQFPNYLM